MQEQKSRSLWKVLGCGAYLVEGVCMYVCAGEREKGREKGGIKFWKGTINAPCYTRRENLLFHTTG